MKKFTLKAITLATASVCGSAAFAGSITAPATTGKYAVEAMLSTTAVTAPAIVYTMGVPRTPAQDFTVIITPSTGSTFTAASCAAAAPVLAPVVSGTGAATVSLKRSSTTECAWEVDVTAATAVGDTLTFTGLVYDTHTLATAGNTVGIVLALKDLGETAFIDNSGTLSANVATSGNALTLVAAADTATQADVNDELGPLFGFVSVGDDVDAVAKAAFVVRNNNDGVSTWKLPDGTTTWDFTLHGTSIAVTVTGNFQGLATGGFLATTGVGGSPTVTATAAGTTATYTLLPTNVTGAGTSTPVTNTFTSARTASLGTSRVFGVSAVGDVATGADVALAGSSSWWTWGANASQLMTPFFNHNVNYITRFFFLNTSSAAVSYSTQCFTEGGGAVVNGAGGTLAANATTNVAASTACTFPASAPRGAVIFTINAPIQSVKGTFQQIAPTGADGVVTPLVRPYTTGATTE